MREVTYPRKNEVSYNFDNNIYNLDNYLQYNSSLIALESKSSYDLLEKSLSYVDPDFVIIFYSVRNFE